MILALALLVAMPPLLLNYMRRIQDDYFRLFTCTVTIISLLMTPIWMGGSKSPAQVFTLAAVSSAYSLKIIELFLSRRDINVSKMTTREFFVRFCMYPDENHLKQWVSSQSNNDAVISDGSYDGLRMLIFDGIFYYFILTCVGFFVPTDANRVIEHGSWFQYFFLFWLSGFGLWSTMGLVYTLTYAPLSIQTGIKVIRPFNHPFRSNNLREWWTNWNVCFKNQFYTIVFSFLNNTNNQQSRDGNGHYNDLNNGLIGIDERQRKIIAALCTFLFSGLLHEYYVLTSVGRKFFGYHMLFFTLHGLSTSISLMFPEIQMRPVFKRLILNLYLTLLMPLFMVPFMSVNIYNSLPIPLAYKGCLQYKFFQN